MLTDYSSVRLTGGYWKKKEDLNRDVTIPAVFDRFNESGRIDAFRCHWREGMPDCPHHFWDSDVAKWMEGAAYILSREDIPELTAKIEWIIDQLEKNQLADGYFNSYFQVCGLASRLTDRDYHELYCAGHLMEAACAYYKATGRDRFLKCMEKYADFLIEAFTVIKFPRFVTPGHEEIEIALFKMYRTTGKKKYLELAKFFLENRGQPENHEQQIFKNARYSQSHAPIREQHEAYGHSVRAMYLYSGMADLAAETGDKELLTACRDLYEDVTERKMYITGGIGSTNLGEAFTVAYDLPNSQAYTETCASIGLMFFSDRMLKADPERPSKYADTVELELYNGALSGLSLSGNAFFYENPLEIYSVERNRIRSTNEGERWPIAHRVNMFWCSCCPPNLNRMLASLGEYFYAYDEENHTVYVNQFGDSTFGMDGAKVSQKTDYPFGDTVSISSNVPVFVRIPGWCRNFSADRPYETVNGYAKFEAGEINVRFPMKPELIASNIGVVRNIGKVALRYGPFIYCAEAVDNPCDLHTLYFDRTTVADAEITVDETFGAPVIALDGWKRRSPTNALYAPLEERFEKTKIKMIPYCCFANRGESDMLVFLNYR